ncbi:MAG: glycosyltransferase family 2 protein [Candidatus Curtissbacteria bacterium]|nr:glycosyltransferase family 2 protein [Candidatus Curtissbacteria bacterium]
MKKSTVSLGIPAYNEEKNIKPLLKSLLEQKLTKVKLNEIIIISDGSTDGTIEEAQSLKSRYLKIIKHKKRSGSRAIQNEIVNRANANVLIILNADVLPVGRNFIEEITAPILRNSKVGLVGADTISASPKTWVEKIIATSHELKKEIYKKINKGSNVYLCHGRARAFSRDFYSQIKWPDDCPEDPYSYFLCIKNGFKFVFAPKAKVLFRSPATFKDHLKQSSRFFEGKEKLKLHFDKQLVEQEYQIPTFKRLRAVVKFMFISPIITTIYLIIYHYIKFFSPIIGVDQAKWEVSTSTKDVI